MRCDGGPTGTFHVWHSSCSNGNCGALIRTESGKVGNTRRPARKIAGGDPYGSHSRQTKLCVMPCACSGTSATPAPAARASKNIRGSPFANLKSAAGISSALGWFATAMFRTAAIQHNFHRRATLRWNDSTNDRVLLQLAYGFREDSEKVGIFAITCRLCAALVKDCSNPLPGAAPRPRKTDDIWWYH